MGLTNIIIKNFKFEISNSRFRNFKFEISVFRSSGVGRAALGLALACLVGCSEANMAKQPKYHRPLEASDFFEDGQASRPLVEGTVARGQLRVDRAFYEGRSGEAMIDHVPMDVDRTVLERGRERFNIYCSPCHGWVGDGQGMIVKRGFSPPPSLHEQRLRDAPAGHFFHVITHGHGAMYSYASRVPPEDRWAIVAYIRALQLSQHASLADVPAEERSKLETKAP
jgi:hypothetical protein